jgi:hypothetical protein
MGNLGVARHAAVFVVKGNNGFLYSFFMKCSEIELTFYFKGMFGDAIFRRRERGMGRSPPNSRCCAVTA